MASYDLTSEELRSLLHYDPETGIFTWRVRRRKIQLGARAGYGPAPNGYRQIRLNYVLYGEHRLVFLYMEGKFPPALVDHINCVRSDNRWANLRHATDTVNAQNTRSASKNNVAGWLGVGTQKGTGRFTAQVSVGTKCHYLGTFDTPEEAHQAYLKAKRKLHEGCTL